MGTTKKMNLDAINGIMSAKSITSFGFQENEANPVKFAVEFCGRRHVVSGISILDNGLLEVEIYPRYDSSSCFRVLAAELSVDALETIFCVMSELFPL